MVLRPNANILNHSLWSVQQLWRVLHIFTLLIKCLSSNDPLVSRVLGGLKRGFEMGPRTDSVSLSVHTQ